VALHALFARCHRLYVRELEFSGHFQNHFGNGWLWEGTTRAEDAQGTPTQSHVSPSILVYEDQSGAGSGVSRRGHFTPQRERVLC